MGGDQPSLNDRSESLVILGGMNMDLSMSVRSFHKDGVNIETESTQEDEVRKIAVIHTPHFRLLLSSGITWFSPRDPKHEPQFRHVR